MKKRKRFKTTEDILFYIGCAGFAVFAAVWPAFLKTAPIACHRLPFSGRDRTVLSGMRRDACAQCAASRACHSFFETESGSRLWGCHIRVVYAEPDSRAPIPAQTENRYEISESLCVCGAGSADGPVACKKYYKNCRSYVDTAA